MNKQSLDIRDFKFAIEDNQRSAEQRIVIIFKVDHVGCWIEFDGTALFRGATECLSSTLKMPFNLRQTSAVEMFIAIMEMHSA